MKVNTTGEMWWSRAESMVIAFLDDMGYLNVSAPGDASLSFPSSAPSSAPSASSTASASGSKGVLSSPGTVLEATGMNVVGATVMVEEPTGLVQRRLALLVLVLIAVSGVMCVLFQRALRKCGAHATVFNCLLMFRSHTLLLNLATEAAIVAEVLRPLSELRALFCVVTNAMTGVLAFTITYLTCWLSLVRLLLLAVALWAPRHAWRLTSGKVHIIIGVLYVTCVVTFVCLLKPGVLFSVCAGLPIENRPNSNVTALGVLFLISTAANTLLLYADATLPPAPPRHRNVLSARRFALFTMCEQLMVLLWVPTTALTTGVTRALLIRVLMIGQAGLMDTLGLALLSPQLRAALFGGRWRRTLRRRLSGETTPTPTIRLELI